VDSLHYLIIFVGSDFFFVAGLKFLAHAQSVTLSDRVGFKFLSVIRYVPVRCYGHKIGITMIQDIQIFKMKYSKYSIKK
jgi:hypothetical protein